MSKNNSQRPTADRHHAKQLPIQARPSKPHRLSSKSSAKQELHRPETTQITVLTYKITDGGQLNAPRLRVNPTAVSRQLTSNRNQAGHIFLGQTCVTLFTLKSPLTEDRIKIGRSRCGGREEIRCKLSESEGKRLANLKQCSKRWSYWPIQ